MFLYDCPYERYIPIYLVVGGCFGIVKNLSNMIQRVHNKRENRDDDNARTNPFDGTLNCFLFAWFIAGAFILLPFCCFDVLLTNSKLLSFVHWLSHIVYMQLQAVYNALVVQVEQLMCNCMCPELIFFMLFHLRTIQTKFRG